MGCCHSALHAGYFTLGVLAFMNAAFRVYCMCDMLTWDLDVVNYE